MNETSHTRAVVLAQPTGPGLHRPPRPHRRGVCYDVGRSFGGPSTRPELDPGVVQRELEIIRQDLHCNAVRICGTDLARIRVAGAQALSLGLEAWLCPELFEHDQATTLLYITEAARTAEDLRRQWPGRVVLSIGTELSWFMQGILEGGTFTDRIAAPTFREQIRGTHVTATLNAFLARAAEAARCTFGELVTYAAAPAEPVDWSLFDVVCIDIYRDAVNRDSFGDLLEPAFAHGKDVVISEVGCCTYTGAQDDGGIGWAIIDYSANPPEIDGDYVRDEGLQASELTEMLKLLECRGVNGIFVMTFVSPTLIHTPDPRTDLDMASFSIVKSYQNRRGATYPDL
jgi:hypothetical protein